MALPPNIVLVRPSSLPARAGLSSTEEVVVDNGVSVAKATVSDIALAGRPTATQGQAEAGTEPLNAMTPLTTKQAIDAQVPTIVGGAIAALNLGSAAQADASDFATAAQGLLADTAVQPDRTITAGNGLTGGGNLSANLTLAVGAGAGIEVTSDAVGLNSVSQAALVAATTAVQPGDLGTMAYEDASDFATAAQGLPAGGAADQVLVKASGTDFDTEWRTSAPAVSYSPQSLTPEQQAQARENIGAIGNLRSISTFYASGTWNRPAGCRAIRVTLKGAGGGGGGGNAAGNQAALGAGGGEGETRVIWDTNPPATCAIVIGAGGAGGVGNAGGSNGGASSFTGSATTTANGGQGGTWTNSGTGYDSWAGGVGGYGGTGPGISFGGSAGGAAIRMGIENSSSGAGGGQGAGRGQNIGATGSPGEGGLTGSGSGGSGAASKNGGGSRTGGTGGSGSAIIEEFF